MYEWPSKQIPEGTPEDEAEQMKLPLRSIAVSGDTLFVADYLGNRVLKFDKVTGESKGEFRSSGRRPWQRTACSTFGSPGPATTFTRCDFEGKASRGRERDGAGGRPGGGPGRVLAVRGRRPRRVASRSLDTHASFKVVKTLGRKARPGDRAADRFFQLNGVAVGKDGNVFTIQDEPYGGARLAKWSPDGRQQTAA